MKGPKLKDWYNVPFPDVLNEYDNKKDNKGLKAFINPIIEVLQQNGINQITEDMSFSQLLKDKGKITKEEMLELIETILNKIGKSKLFHRRTIKRSSYYFNDILLVYAVSQNSHVMLDIGNTFFVEFNFHKKFGNNISDIKNKWNKIVQNIQNHFFYSHLFSDDEVNLDDCNPFIDQFDFDPDFLQM